MTVETEVTRVIVAGNGVTTAFSYTFPIPGSSSTDQTNAELLLLGTDSSITVLADNLWSITGVETDVGGTVTYPLSGSPVTTGAFLILNRIVPYLQSTSLSAQGAYSPEVVEAALDNLAFQTEQLNTRLLQAVRAPIADAALSDLPTAEKRANSFLYFDDNGDVTTASSTGGSISGVILVGTNSTNATRTQTLLLTGPAILSVTTDTASVTTVVTTASTGSGSGTITVTDGTHTASNATTINFTSNATVTNSTGSTASVAITGGGGGGGGLVYLSTVTASNSATMDILTGFSDTYDNYLVVLTSISPANNNVALGFQISHNAGSSWLGSTNFSWDLYTASVGSVAGSAAGSAASALVALNLNNASGQTISGKIWFNDLRSATDYKETYGVMTGLDASSTLFNWTSDSLSQDNANKTNGIRFLMSSGNIASGTAILYGLAKS